MDQENVTDKKHQLSEALAQLNTLMHEVTLESSSLQTNLRAFVSIYVRVNSLSEDVFIAFCQYEVIQKLFGLEAKQIGVIGILQMFNLILANTSQTNALVYIFSQPIVHEFLFSKFDVSIQNSQTVQYYVQLLKTIIMKINNGQASLIKMFCNNRYCSFPLLTQVCYLATQSKEELVRVTAQQCVLLLIQLLNSKQIGRGYLAQIQIAVFYHELTQIVASQKCDIEGYLKYIGDLVVALQDNTLSLSMLANAFCINVMISLLGNLPFLLKIFRTLSTILAQQQALPIWLYQQIKLIFGKILSKYCFNQFLNGTYLYSIKYKKSYSEKISYNQLNKYFRTRFEHMHHFLSDIQDYSDQQYNSHGVLAAWKDFNRNRDLRDLKINDDKRTGIFKFFQSKPDPLQTYIRLVLAANGMNYDTSSKTFLFKLEKSIHSGSAIFFIEKILLHQQVTDLKEITQAEVHFNDNRGNFDFTLPFCQQLLHMISSLEKHQISINAEVHRQQLKDLQFQYMFLRRLKLYLINNLSDFILKTDKEYSPAEMCQIRKVLRKLDLSRHLEKKTVQKMLWKMEQLQSDINELTFMRDFKLLIQYVLHSYSDKLYNVQGQLPAHLQDPICGNMLKYEFISQILDPSRPSIQKFIEHQWSSFIQEKLNLYKLTFTHQTKNYFISIVPKYNMKFQIKISDHIEKDILKIDIKQPKPFQQIVEQQKMMGWEWQGEKLREQDQKLIELQLFGACSQREEVITKWIVQYFQMTYNRLCSFLAKKHQKSMIIDSF